MSLPQVISAYTDCFEYFDKALASTKGIRVEFATKPEAKMFTMRMAQARVLQRQETRRMYERDHPLFDKSEYDCFIVRSAVEDQDGHWWVYIERANARALAVEEIEDGH